MAPGIISSFFSDLSCPSASRFIASTGRSFPPTMRSVGASTVGKADAAKSGLPPRDTTACIVFGRSFAAIRQAAAPVLEPKQPILRCLVYGCLISQSVMLITLRARRSISNRSFRVRISISSSSGVSKSINSVASSPSRNIFATNVFRGLCLLLPLPCANKTIPSAPGRDGQVALKACRIQRDFHLVIFKLLLSVHKLPCFRDEPVHIVGIGFLLDLIIPGPLRPLFERNPHTNIRLQRTV